MEFQLHYFLNNFQSYVFNIIKSNKKVYLCS